MKLKEIPEGYVPVYFHIGIDALDDSHTLVQVDEFGDQVQTDTEWKVGTHVRKGVLLVPEKIDFEKDCLCIRLDIKPEQAQLVHHNPEPATAMPYPPSKPTEKPFDWVDTRDKNAIVLTDDGYFGHLECGQGPQVPAKEPIKSYFDDAFAQAIKKSVWDKLK